MSKRLPDATGRPHRTRPLVHAARRRLTPDERRQVVADYEAGRSTTWLMRIITWARAPSSRSWLERGVAMRGQGIPDDRLEEAVVLYKSGLSSKALAARLDCSAETVRQALMRAGVAMRARWERGPH
jgi:hypothetical protein